MKAQPPKADAKKPTGKAVSRKTKKALAEAGDNLIDEQDAPPPSGHNKAPTPLQLIEARIKDAETGEIGNWLDGEKIINDGQLEAVEELLIEAKTLEKDANAAREAEWRPLKTATDTKSAEWKAPLDAAARLKTGLLAISGSYKVAKRAAEDAEVRRLKLIADNAAREAEAIAKQADMGNLDERKEADEAKLEARKLSQQAGAVKANVTRGLRNVSYAEITDYKALINWIAVNDKPALSAFMDDYAKRHFRGKSMDGVATKTKQVAI